MEINKLILNILSKQRAKDSRNTLETKKKKKLRRFTMPILKLTVKVKQLKHYGIGTRTHK